MVSTNYDASVMAFTDMIGEMDLAGWGFALAVGGAGALLAEHLTQFVVGELGQPVGDAAGAKGTAIAGTVVLLISILAGYLAVEMGGLTMQVLGGAAMGAFILASITYYDAVQKSGVMSFRESGSQSNSRSTKNKPRSRSTSRATTRKARSSRTRPDDFEYRSGKAATSADSGSVSYR